MDIKNWKQSPKIQEAKENFKKVGVEDKINLFEGDAVEILPTLNRKYDILYKR